MKPPKDPDRSELRRLTEFLLGASYMQTGIILLVLGSTLFQQVPGGIFVIFGIFHLNRSIASVDKK